MVTSEEVFAKLAALGLELPPRPTANGSYDLVVQYRGLAYVSGQLPRTGSALDELMQGRLRTRDDVPLGQAAARLCLLRSLLALHFHLGDLSRVDRVVSIRGFLNADPAFTFHARVLDAASDLARELFGENGGHVRSALGAGSLPSGGLVEIELVVGVVDDALAPPNAGA